MKMMEHTILKRFPAQFYRQPAAAKHTFFLEESANGKFQSELNIQKPIFSG